jgi:molybdopterin-guanine dinucleotide biosynthesis protein A
MSPQAALRAAVEARRFDAVVLAGGTGARMGGASKPDVALGGRRLLDHALEAAAGAGRVAVVAPASVPVPPGVVRTLESPAHGGPVAGIAAGLHALAVGGPPAPLVLVLSCDAPHAASAVDRLLRAAADSPSGACLVDPDGRPQWLVAVHSSGALRDRLAHLSRTHGGLRGLPARALAADPPLVLVPGTAREVTDVDTWADLEALEGASGGRRPWGPLP